jgi:hypothetical protein
MISETNFTFFMLFSTKQEWTSHAEVGLSSNRAWTVGQIFIKFDIGGFHLKLFGEFQFSTMLIHNKPSFT